ncbi:protein Tob/BTG, partial [Phenoliferia sp. Uapishka_3]
MDSELAAATSFLSSYLPLPSQAPFSIALHSHLASRYANHWHPSDPERGSAFRTLIRNGDRIDDSVVRATTDARVSRDVLESSLGGRLGKVALGERWTLWVDPGCVSLRVDRTDGATPGVGREGQFIEIYGKLPESLSSHAVPLDVVAQSLNKQSTTMSMTSATPAIPSAHLPTPTSSPPFLQD